MVSKQLYYTFSDILIKLIQVNIFRNASLTIVIQIRISINLACSTETAIIVVILLFI